MKKYYSILATIAAISFVSCQKEISDSSLNENAEFTVLRADVAPDTKVAADASGNYTWQAGDVIAVFNNSGSPVSFSTTSSGSSVDFTAASGVSFGSYAVYPYSASSSESGKVVTFNLPTSYTYRSGETNMPMLGKISGSSATFKAVGGLIKLTVYNVPSDATALTFTATNQKITGNFTISDATVSEPVIALAAKGSGDDAVTINFSGNRSDNMVFYIPLPTGTMTGFTISFNDTATTSKTVTKSLTIARNGIIIAPGVNLASAVVMWRESFTGYSANKKFSNESIQTGTGYDAEYYGSATIKYTSADGTGGSSKETRIYTTEDDYNAASVPEMYVGKTGGYFNVTGIPTSGAGTLNLTFYSNNEGISVTTTTANVTIGSITTSGKKRTATITNSKNATTIDLKFAVGSGNSRLDDISVTTTGAAAAIPEISTGTDAVTISAGNLNASVSSVALANAMDANGISFVIDPASTWISSATIISGDIATGNAVLQISASGYNHGAAARVGYVYLRATGAISKTITVTQNPTTVPSPSLTATPGNATFSITWTADTKAKSYMGFYSTSDISLDPTTGTALTITNDGSAYTATPSGVVSNGTTYNVYVIVNEVGDSYAAKYAPSPTWATTTVKPSTSNTVTFTLKSSEFDSLSKTDATSGITLTLGDHTYGSNPSVGSTYTKVYAGNTIRISGATFTKVEFTATTSGYIKTWSASDSTTCSVSGEKMTWEKSAGASDITFENTASAQARIQTVVITY